jgi:FkbM family methyltransferase
MERLIGTLCAVGRKWRWARGTAGGASGGALRLLALLGAAWLLAAAGRRTGRRLETAVAGPNGRRFRVAHRLDYGDLNTLLAVFGGGAVPMPPIPNHGGPAVVVDLGAHIGLASLWLSDVLPPGSRFVCVEPEPGNLELLRLNLARHLPDALILPFAVGALRGHGWLRLRAASDSHALSPTPGDDGPAGAIGVPVATPSEILDRARLDTVDLLKIDIEGAEHLLVRDIHLWGPQVRGALLIEVHGDAAERAPTLAALERAGFVAADGDAWRPGAMLLHQKIAQGTVGGSRQGNARPLLLGALHLYNATCPAPAHVSPRMPGRSSP